MLESEREREIGVTGVNIRGGIMLDTIVILWNKVEVYISKERKIKCAYKEGLKGKWHKELHMKLESGHT